MSVYLQELTKIEPPPAYPVAPGTPADWLEVEKTFGLQLPQDYKDFISLYGAGQWADFFGIMNPFYNWKHPQAQGYFKWRQTRLAGLTGFRQKYPKDTAPFSVYPDPEGLFPIGYNDNGGTICWQVIGDQGSWPIVCLDGKLSETYDKFETNLTGFLVGLLTEKISPKTFPEELFPASKPMFQPYSTE